MRWGVPLAALAIVVTVAMNLVSFGAGRRAGSGSPGAMAERFAAGKATFCDLDEDARLRACPAMRKTVLFPDKGIAVAYACDTAGSMGFVSFLGVASETKAQAIGKFLEMGLLVKPHCRDGIEEVLSIGRGPWKTAAIP